MIDNQPPEQDQNLPVQYQGTTAVARPMGSGRTPPPQSWQTGEPDAIPWGQYIDAIRRRWWVVALIAAIGIVGGKMYSRTIPSEYEAKTKIFISSAASSALSGGQRPSNVLTINTLRDLLTSQPIVMPVVRDLALNVRFKDADSSVFRGFAYDSAFVPGGYRLAIDSASGYTLTRMPADAGQSEHGAVGDSIGRQFGFYWKPARELLKPKRVIDFSVLPVHIRAEGLAHQLVVEYDEEGGQFLTLTLTGDSRKTVAPILNAWAQRFITAATDLKRTEIVRSKDILQKQTDQLHQAMVNAENAYRQYRDDNVFGSTTTEGPNGTAALASQQAQLDQIKRDKARLQAILNEQKTSHTIDDSRFAVMPAILSSQPRLQSTLTAIASVDQELATWRGAVTDSAPKVKALLSVRANLVDTVFPSIISGIITSLEESERTLGGDLNTRSDELKQIPRRAIESARRQRDYADATDLFTTVNKQNQQLKLIDEQTTSDLQVMGVATDPVFPSSSKGPRLFIMAVAGSLALGVAVALLLDRLDRRFRYPQQATMELGLTIAGTIPFFKPNRKGELNLTASAQVVESFRTLRLATQYHFPVGEPIVVCISSPGPGEGKSLVASNLAVAFANAGQKTLLIDGDVRRGVVHTTFESERRPGLVDYLGGTATSAQIIRPTSTDHLYIIPSGSRSRRAPELLVSDRMAALVAEMRTQYEVVIIDSAPFVAGMDSFALGAAAGTMLVVLRPGVTDRKLAENKLEIMDRLPITIIGAVLNAISSGRAYRYYSDYATYEGEIDVDETDFDGPGTPTTRLIGRR